MCPDTFLTVYSSTCPCQWLLWSEIDRCPIVILWSGQSVSYNLPINFSNNSEVCIPPVLTIVSPWKCHFLTPILIFTHFFVMQPGCGIHYLIILLLYPLVFTPLKWQNVSTYLPQLLYSPSAHTLLKLYLWVQFNISISISISNDVLFLYPLSILDIKYYREKLHTKQKKKSKYINDDYITLHNLSMLLTYKVTLYHNIQ